MCLKALGDQLSSRVLANLLEMLKKFWRPFQQCLQYRIHFGKSPNKRVHPMGVSSNGSPANREKKTLSSHRPPSLHIFQAFFCISSQHGFLLNFVKNLKTISGFYFGSLPTVPLLVKFTLVQLFLKSLLKSLSWGQSNNVMLYILNICIESLTRSYEACKKTY
jgi:hypothetical protein